MITPETISFVMSGQARRQMVLQRGDIEDGEEWEEAWAEELHKTMVQIRYAPKRVLDIGSGVGAVDVLLCRFIGSHCTLVDGEDGVGEVRKHAIPFGNRKVTEQFFKDNGIDASEWRYLNPQQFVTDCEANPITDWHYDLVISTRSWCFHYAPGVYLETVKLCTKPGTSIMVDVRHDRPEWFAQLEAAWPDWQVVERQAKFDRIKYVVGE